MVDYKAKIKEFEEELRKTPYNKRTQHHIGLVKAKIAMLKRREVARRKSTAAAAKQFAVRKSGDATVIMVGFPSCGKSSLLNAITKAESPVGEYDFTTLEVIPGLLEHRDAKIQILDVPGIVMGAAAGRGRGKEVLSMLHSANLVLFLVDTLRPDAYEVIKKEVYDSNLRVNQKKPDLTLKKTGKGGINILKTVKLPGLTNETIKAICKELRINNAEILIRSKIKAEQLIDVIEANKIYVPAITVLNKIDLVDRTRLNQVTKKIKPDICISAKKKINITELKELIFHKLDFIRVYCKEVRKKADLEIPLIMKKNSTIEDMCRKLHKDFITKFRYAKVWGKSAKFPGQILMMKHKLKDKDVVEIHLR